MSLAAISGEMQCVAVCCSVWKEQLLRLLLQFRVSFSVLQCVAVCYSALQRVAACCSML